MPVGAGQGTTGDRRGAPRSAVGWFWRMFGGVVVALRYPILLAWIAAAVAATAYLPVLATSGGLNGLIPSGSPAAKAEADAARLFGEPLASAGVAVVQRNPAGFPPPVQVAAAIDHRDVRGIPGLVGSLPVANTAGRFPGSRERSTTIVTFLSSTRERRSAPRQPAHRRMRAAI